MPGQIQTRALLFSPAMIVHPLSVSPYQPVRHSFVSICLIVVYTPVIIPAYAISRKGGGSREPLPFPIRRSSFLPLFFLRKNARCPGRRAFFHELGVSFDGTVFAWYSICSILSSDLRDDFGNGRFSKKIWNSAWRRLKKAWQGWPRKYHRMLWKKPPWGPDLKVPYILTSISNLSEQLC